MTAARLALRGVVLAGFALAGCKPPDGGASPASRGAPAVPVAVAKAERRDYPERLRAIGTVEAVATVLVKPQLSGQLKEARFAEGQEVAAGDVLLLLDARPYEAAVHEAEANLARNSAVAADAARMLERVQRAGSEGVSSPRELEQAQAQAEASQASVLAAQAQVEQAKLNLDYCTIRAPIAGRAGTLMVKPGNVVKENETALVEINQLAPINVAYSIPERYLPAVRTSQARAGSGDLAVDASHPGERAEPIRGSLAFIDNKVDTATGTIRLRASFPNGDHRLWPGEFVEVAFTIAVRQGVVVVPASAVQSSQKGSTVYVIKGDTAEERPVKVDRTDEQVAVIAEGLNGDETVVTDGQLRLTPGAKVQVKGEGK
jgi:membrane fusion protein, multidrug efflux system